MLAHTITSNQIIFCCVISSDCANLLRLLKPSADRTRVIAGALGVKIGDIFSKEKIAVQKIIVKEKSPLSKLSPQDLQLIKKVLQLLNKTFSKV